jgi:hypothetical protein
MRDLVRVTCSLKKLKSLRDFLAEEVAKKTKALLKEPRAQLELGCGFSWNNGGGFADTDGIRQGKARVLL